MQVDFAPVRVLLVNSHGADASYGGAERYVAELREGLERRGVGCTVLSAYPVREGRRDELGVLHDSDWRAVPTRRLADHAESWRAPPNARLHAAVAAADADLVHTSNLFGIATGIWECARRLGLPVVHTLHDYGLLCPRTTLRRRDGTRCRPHPMLCGLRARRLARWAPAVREAIGVSSQALAVHEPLWAPTTGTCVIRAPLRPMPGLAPPGSALRTLGYLGRLHEAKGVVTLLEAAPALAALGVRVRIAGDGPLRARVAAAPDVDYVGRIPADEVAPFLASCDAGVVPSLWDEPGLTYSALEWLAAGRPLLSTGRGGLAELPATGVVGFDASVPDLVTRVGELRANAHWMRLVAGGATQRARASDGRDSAAWVDAHLDSYARAGAPDER